MLFFHVDRTLDIPDIFIFSDLKSILNLKDLIRMLLLGTWMGRRTDLSNPLSQIRRHLQRIGLHFRHYPTVMAPTSSKRGTPPPEPHKFAVLEPLARQRHLQSLHRALSQAAVDEPALFGVGILSI